MKLERVSEFIVGVRELVESAIDIHGGTAVGLLTLGVAWAMFHGHDIGVGSAAAYSTAIAAFAYSNTNGPKQS